MIDKNFIEQARRYQKEIYGAYGPYLYQPMAEAHALPLPVTRGCSYNKCLYCDLNHKIDFYVLSLDEVEENLKKLSFIKQHRRRPVERVVLLGGNPLVLPTEHLKKLAQLIKKYFPKTSYISSFARVEDILSKSKRELISLRESGYDRFSLGIESGSDRVLSFHKKGSSRRDNLMAMKKLDQVSLSYSTYLMLGLGGREYSEEHALETASLISQAQPFEINLVTMVAFKDAALIEEIRTGNFKRLSPLESLEEEYKLIKNMDLDKCLLNASHKTNMIPIKGYLKRDQERILKQLEKSLDRAKDKNLGVYEHRRWNSWSTE